MENNTSSHQEHSAPTNHFIFPGFRELLIGLAVLVGLEFLTGTSNLVAMPFQKAFLAVGALVLIEVAALYGFFKIGAFGIIVPVLCLSIIDYLFPELSISLPKVNSDDNYLWKIWVLVKSIFNAYGWFLTIGSLLLLFHIGQKHGDEIEAFLK